MGAEKMKKENKRVRLSPTEAGAHQKHGRLEAQFRKSEQVSERS
jgi:hypothetical protein